MRGKELRIEPQEVVRDGYLARPSPCWRGEGPICCSLDITITVLVWGQELMWKRWQWGAMVSSTFP